MWSAAAPVRAPFIYSKEERNIMLFTTIHIRKTERGLLLRNGDFERVLLPGKHRLWSLLDKLRLETFSIEQAAFNHALTDYLLTQEPRVVGAHFVPAMINETQVGLRYENGVLFEILAPSTRRLYWKGLQDTRIDVVDIADQAQVPPSVARLLTQSQLRGRAVAGLQGVTQLQVPEHGVGLLWIDGKLDRQLSPGSWTFWKFNRNIVVELIDLRLQSMEVSGQEILTRDKVALRLNMLATWRYTDVMQAFRELAKPVEHIYRELQLGLRAAVGTRTLDELLDNKTLIDEVVSSHVGKTLTGLGLKLESVGVKDIVLPGEMKTILAQVVEAAKSAEANVIRRREETAATRSLLNTAKVMEDNPTALRLKELETLERVAERIDKISVFGGLDQVLNGLVKIKA
jgi:regulator of protease activity HflC (stomatin/prohibitin superfamily)